MTGGAGTATYQWLADGKDIFGEDDETLLVTEDYIGSKLSVEVTDEEGNTAVSEETAIVTADKSDDVSIIDKMGLQSDGTAIIGDILAISYGVDFGTPTAASWYKDGTVIETMGSGNTGIGFELPITAARGTGTYKATVVAEGKTYTTNEIVVTKKEEAATILDFVIEDDYTDGTDITYDTDDNTAVASVTLSKNYAGTIGIYKSNDSKFSGRINRFTTNTTVSGNPVADYVNADAGGTGVNRAIGANASVLTTDAPTNYNVLNAVSGSNRAIGHINADGTVTYKFNIAAGTLTRGSDYVVTFDQNSILTDTPGTGIANVFDEAATVPYVTAPAAIAVTKVSANNKPEVTFQDEDGADLSWMQAQKGGATLAATGFATAQIYSAKSKTNDPKGSDVTALAGATQANTVEKGVWTSGVTAPADPSAYWFAVATTKKGIYGEKAETFTSEAAPLAQKAATMMNLVESKTDARAATVTFENLRADGTLYIVRGSRVWNTTAAIGAAPTTDYYSTAAQIYESYNAGVSEATTGKIAIEAGTKTVDVTSAIDEWKAEQTTKTVAAGNSENWYGNKYIAVFIPDDEENYGLIYTNSTNFNASTELDKTSSTDSAGMTLGQVATTLTNDKDTIGTISGDGTDLFTITSTKLLAKDQFGNAMTTFQAPTDVTSVTATNKDLTNKEVGTAKFSVAANGQISIFLTVDTATDGGDGYTINMLGSTITVMNTATAAIAKTATPGTGWEVKVDGNAIVKGLTSALGTAVVTFPKLAGTPATTTAQIAYYTGALATGATASMESSTNGITWVALGTDDTLDLATAGKILEDGTLGDYTCDQYLRIKISATGYQDAYVTMQGSKTDSPALARLTTPAPTVQTIVSGADKTAATVGAKDQFGTAFNLTAVPTTALVADSGNADCTGTIAIAANGVATFNLTDGTTGTGKVFKYVDGANGLTWTLTSPTLTNGAVAGTWTLAVTIN